MADIEHKAEDGGRKISKKADSRLQEELGEKRSGSESDSTSGRKQSRLHENHHERNDKPEFQPEVDFDRDLHSHNQGGEDRAVNQALTPGAVSADTIKDLHNRVLADLTNDELKSIFVLPAGTQLEQGAKYIDLENLAQGEFVAQSNMITEPGHYYVAKKGTDYVLWNRLNQVDNATRLDDEV